MSTRQATCIIALIVLSIAGCDSNFDPAGEDGQIGTVGSAQTESPALRLEKSHLQGRQAFSTYSEYAARVEELETAPEIVLNADLYHKLKHANTAAEVSVLDMNGEVQVGEHVYSVTERGVYRRLAGNPPAENILVQYYGMDGYQDLRETMMLIGNFRLGQLDNVKLEEVVDPTARELYITLASINDGKTSLDGSSFRRSEAHEQSVASKTSGVIEIVCDYNMPNSVDACTHYFDNIIAWGGGGNLVAGNYEVVVESFNQSYRNGLNERARGGTVAWVRAQGSNSYDDWISMAEMGAYGSNAAGTIGQRFLLEVWVSGGKGTDYNLAYGYAYESIPRKAGVGATSRHAARIDFNGTSSYPYYISNYYVP